MSSRAGEEIKGLDLKVKNANPDIAPAYTSHINLCAIYGFALWSVNPSWAFIKLTPFSNVPNESSR